MPKYDRNGKFVNRPKVFELLNEHIKAIQESKRCKPVVIRGLGGTGKSQIALEFCYQNEDKYQYIFWMDADTETTLQTDFMYAARMLDLPALTENSNSDDVVPRMIQFFQTIDCRWLLVFNNADDYSLGKEKEPFRLHNK